MHDFNELCSVSPRVVVLACLLSFVLLWSCSGLDQSVADSQQSESLGEDKSPFLWPEPPELSQYLEYLEQTMTAYSTQVGMFFDRSPQSAGEKSWRACRPLNAFAVIKSIRGGVDNYCAVVRSVYVDKHYEGSEYSQYGNCDEGSHVGACLGLRAGFSLNQVYRCTSVNDHAFALVQDPGAKTDDMGFCVLDRWNLLGKWHFFCSVKIERRSQGGLSVFAIYDSASELWQKV